MSATIFVISTSILIAWIVYDKIRMRQMLREIRKTCKPIIEGEKHD